MAAEGLKVLSFAYKDIAVAELGDIMEQFNPESDEFRQKLESDLIYLCTFGLDDPLREGVKESIEAIKYVPDDVGEDEEESGKPSQKHVNVYMVTGDHKKTAISVAVQSGIITQAQS